MPIETEQRDELAAKLRSWATGYKPEKAAVDFMLDSGDLFWDTAGICLRYDDIRQGRPYIEWDNITEESLGGLSSGTKSMYRLALSMRRGEISDAFWRLDPTRQKAFIHALARHH